MKCLFINIFFFVIYFNVYSQTSGISEVTSIESKVKKIEENTLKIKQMKNELPGLEAEWNLKMQKESDELAALYKEMTDIVEDMKVGARCSQCKKWKSEFEKRGENFEKHLGEVNGVAIPATTSELEDTRKKYREKIAIKKVQIQNLENANPVTRKLGEIQKLEEINEKLCKEVTNHSKRYEEIVVSGGKNLQTSWSKHLLNFVANILIADDKITIHNAHIVRLKIEFQEESIRAKKKIEAEGAQQKVDYMQKIYNLNTQKDILNKEMKNYIELIRSKINELELEKNNVERELNNITTPDSIKVQLLNNQTHLASSINALIKNIDDYATNTNFKLDNLKTEIKNLEEKIGDIQFELPKLQEKEILKIKQIYDKKISDTQIAVSNATDELTRAKKEYRDKADFYNKENLKFVNLIISESDRMVTVGKIVSCSIYNQARFTVMGNWNKIFPCVDALTKRAKPYSTHVFNTYCSEETSETHLSSYKSFLLGLSTEDKEAVIGNSNKWWFEGVSK